MEVRRIRYAADEPAKEQYIDQSSRQKLETSFATRGAAAGVAPGDIYPEWEERKWATELPNIAQGKDSFIGVLHADGNRIGGFLIDLSASIKDAGLGDDAVAALYRRFSDGLAKATQYAVIDALKSLTPRGGAQQELPARPVVIGGDDVTLILPSEDALQITEQFLASFARHTEEMLDGFRKEYPQVPVFQEPKYRRFTACAGVVFQKHKFPLLMGYDYADKLCGYAKRESTQPDGTTTSSLYFVRHLDSDESDLVQRIDQNFIDSTSKIRVGAGPYAIKADQGLITVENLRELSQRLHAGDLAKNSARDIIDQLHQSPLQAERAFERALEIGGARTKSLKNFLNETREQRSERAKGFHLLSPLHDAAILAIMEQK